MTLICDIKYIINPCPPEKVKSPSKLKPQWTWSWGDWIKSLVLSVLSCFSSSAAKELAELNASYETDLPPHEAQAKAKAQRIRSQVLGARREILNQVWLVNGKSIQCIEAIIDRTDVERDAAIERLVTDDSVWPEEDFRNSEDLYKHVRPIIYRDYTNGVINWEETDRHQNGKIGFIPACKFALTGVVYRPPLTPHSFFWNGQDVNYSRWQPNSVRTFEKFYHRENDEVALLKKDALKARLLSSSSEEVS